MEEKIIKGIKYRLNEKTLTAEVIRKRGYSGDIVIPETVVNQNVSYKVTCIDALASDVTSSFDRLKVIYKKVGNNESQAFGVWQ